MDIKKNIFIWLSLAILIRILIMPFYFHPDIKTFNFQASFLKNGVLDIYSYLQINKSSLPLKEDFVYFPLTYFFLGSYQVLVSPLLGNNFYNWLADASITATQDVGTFRYLAILKFPYLIFDILIAFLLAHFFTDSKRKQQAFLIWLFNPFSIILIYVYSNLDIIPVTFSLLSLLFALRKNFFLAGLCLGMGAGFKAFPLVFLPLLLFYAENWKQKTITLLTALGSISVIMAPFIMSEAYRSSALISGLTTRILLPSIGIGFGEGVLIALAPLLMFFIYIHLKKDSSRETLIYSYFITLVLILSFIHFHIQWLLWIIPFGILLIVQEHKYTGIVILSLLSGFLIPLLYNDASMSVSLLSAISPWFSALPTPFKIAHKIYDPYVIQSILHTYLACVGVMLTWHIFKGKA